MPTYPHEITDPFDYMSVPSLSWKNLPVGTIFTLEVLEPARALQSTNFETRQPAWWDDACTRPKMAAVLNVLVLRGPHSVGEERSIWAPIPSSMFAALKEAQSKAETKFARGGILEVRFSGEVPHKNPHFNPIKQYEAQYDPSGHATGPDPFIPEPPETSPQPPQPPQETPQPQLAWNVSKAGTTPRMPQEAPRVAGGGFSSRRGR